MNVWGLRIAFVGSPPSEDNWRRAEEIVDALREREPDGRVGQRAGAYWAFEYGATEDTLEQAIAEVERRLAAIDSEAPELLSVEQNSG